MPADEGNPAPAADPVPRLLRGAMLAAVAQAREALLASVADS